MRKPMPKPGRVQHSDSLRKYYCTGRLAAACVRRHRRRVPARSSSQRSLRLAISCEAHCSSELKSGILYFHCENKFSRLKAQRVSRFPLTANLFPSRPVRGVCLFAYALHKRLLLPYPFNPFSHVGKRDQGPSGFMNISESCPSMR